MVASSFPGPLTNTGMDDHLWAGKPPQYFTKPPRPTLLALIGIGNEYQPKCSDALRLWVKGMYGAFQFWINVWVAGKTVISH